MSDAKKPNPKFLRHKKTGEVFVFSEVLAKRDDMEPTNEAPKLPPALPVPPMQRATPSSQGHHGHVTAVEVERIVASAIAPLMARIAVLEQTPRAPMPAQYVPQSPIYPPVQPPPGGLSSETTAQPLSSRGKRSGKPAPAEPAPQAPLIPDPMAALMEHARTQETSE